MKNFFVFRGLKLRLLHRHNLRIWKIFLSLPFLVLLALYHYFITYPVFAEVQDFSDWKIYIQPVLVTFLGLLVAFLVSSTIVRGSELRDGFFMKSKKRQMLAIFMYSNNIVERKTVKREKGSVEKKKFPKAYYRAKKDVDVFTFATGNQFHGQVINLGKTLSEMYLADLTKINWEMGFISYEFLSNNLSKRISFEKVSASDGKITLMNGVVWEYDKLPHMLITGGTGGGKTYFIYALLYALVQEGRVHIADPKMADLAEFANFKAFKGLVVHDKADILEMVKEAVELMDKRYIYMKQQDNYTVGKNYRYYGMEPEFIIIDELSAFVSVLSSMEDMQFQDTLTPLVLKARQAGVYFIGATQRPDANTLPGQIRDNLLCRVSLGRLSPIGYEMTFPDSKDKAFVNKDVIGRGYIDIGTGIPIEFYSPLVNKKFDFVEHFKNIPPMPFTDVSHIELTPEAKAEVNEFYDDISDFEQEFIESAKDELIKEEEKQKEENIEKLMSEAGVPSYRNKLGE